MMKKTRNIRPEKLNWIYGADYYLRERLVRDRLDADDLSLIGMYADSGFGKTTLFRSFLAMTGYNAVWYDLFNMNQYDAEFLHGLRWEIARLKTGRIAAKQPGFNGVYEEEVDDLLDELEDYDELNQRLYIVIDNYQRAENDARLNNLIDQILARDFHNVKLVILSWTRPYRSFLALKAKGKYLELGPEELKFTKKETENFFCEFNGIKLQEHEIYSIWKKLNGWVAGYMLVRDHLKREHDDMSNNEFWENFSMGLKDVFTYLNEEVYENEAQDIKDFMTQSSCLVEMESDLLDEILQRNDSKDILTYLSINHKFTEQKDNRKWLYYTLFREFLYIKAYTDEPGRVRDNHRKAAAVFHRRNDYLAAFSHALAAESYEYAAKLMNELYLKSEPLNFVNIVNGYIEEVSPVLHFADSTLFLTMCIPGRMLSEFIVPLTEHLAMAKSRHDIEKVVGIELRIGTINYVLGDIDHATECFERVNLNAERINDHASQAYSNILLMDCYRAVEDLESAFQCARIAMYLINRFGLNRIKGLAQENLINLYIDNGDYESASLHLERALRTEQGCGYMEFWLYTSKCRLLRAQGMPEAAIKYGEMALDYATSNNISYYTAYAAIKLARCYIKCGQYDKANKMLEMGYESAIAYKGLLYTILRYQIEVYEKSGDGGKARAIEKRLENLEKHVGFMIIVGEPSDYHAKVKPAELSGKLHIQTLGEFGIYRFDQKVNITRKSSLSLLQYLIVNRDRFVIRDAIIEEILPEKARNKNNYNVALSTLRKELDAGVSKRDGDSAILRSGDMYRLNIDKIELDADSFVSIAGKTDAAQAGDIGELLRAEQMYKGEFMQEYPYVDFLEIERERMRILYKHLVVKIAEHYLHGRDAWRSREYFEKAIKTDPYDEEIQIEYIISLLDCRAVYQARTAAKKMIESFEGELGVSVREELEEIFAEHRLIF